VVDEHIAEEALIKELNMSNLPTLSKKFIELLDLLV
jgi:callose synthase